MATDMLGNEYDPLAGRGRKGALSLANLASLLRNSAAPADFELTEEKQ
jgi:hypothetical protein